MGVPPVSSEITRIGRVQAVRLPGNRAALTGTLAEVAPLLAALRRAGTLAAMSNPTPVDATRVLVTVRLRPRTTLATPATPHRRGRWRTATVATGIGLVLAAGAVWAAWAAVMWILAHLAVLAVAAAILTAAVTLRCRRRCTTVVTVTHRHR